FALQSVQPCPSRNPKQGGPHLAAHPPPSTARGSTPSLHSKATALAPHSSTAVSEQAPRPSHRAAPNCPPRTNRRDWERSPTRATPADDSRKNRTCLRDESAPS